MPQLIRYLDQIAIEKQRDILFVDFDGFTSHYERRPVYRQFIAMLDANAVAWEHCAPRGSLGDVGLVYVDVPFDENDGDYQKVRDFLENPDGNIKHKRVRFLYMPLDMAKEQQRKSR